MYQGQVRRNKDAVSIFTTDADLQHTVGKWIANRKFSKLLDLWAKGLELNWNELYPDAKPRRISLPTYPFAKERYWIEAAVGDTTVTATVLHPLRHSHPSGLNGQRHHSTLPGAEFFIAHHPVAGHTVLPRGPPLHVGHP